MSANETGAKAPAAPIPSATVLVVRDGPAGVEVFMLVRNRVIDFASGALVFPGGKVDADDHDPQWEELAPHAALQPERSYWVASVRETFEETGLLIADDRATGRLVEANRAIGITAASQKAIANGARRFSDLIASERLTIATTRMVPFAHWVTPVTMPKRFDTHFFLAEAPAGQPAVHDGGETVESVWINPRQAIREAEAGTRTLVPATTLNLEKLAKASTVREAFELARTIPIVTITPTVAKAEGGVRISIPQNSGYDTTDVYVPRASPA